MNRAGSVGALEGLDLVDPDLARFLTEVDFDLDDSLLDDWEDGIEDVGDGGGDSSRSSSSRKNTIAQQMRKAGYTVDVLREEDLERIQLIHDRLTNDHIYKERKRPRYKDGIPRIMRNDIRWCYSQMFMNTVNSGDFVKMQNFFHTFMTKPCKFIVDHVLDPSFSIPHRLLVQGPKLMAHYLLGVFVLFPDLVLTMTDSKIISARGWTGSKITIDFEMKSTKVYDLSLESWVPQVKYLARARKGGADSAADALEEGEIPPSEFDGASRAEQGEDQDQDQGAESAMDTTSADGFNSATSSSSSSGAEAGNSRTPTPSPVEVSAFSSFSSSSSSASASASASTTISTTSTSNNAMDPYANLNPIYRPTTLAVPEGYLPRLFQMGRVLDISEGAGADYVTAEDTEIRRKGYRYMSSAKKRATGAGIAASARAGSEEAEGEPGSADVGGKRKLAASGAAADGGDGADGNGENDDDGEAGEDRDDSAVGAMRRRVTAAAGGALTKTSDLNPELLIKALFTTARLQKEPQFLHARGTMTIFLDGNNNMQHINLLLEQVRN